MAVVPGEKALSAFREHFGSEAQAEMYRAPGRVNLIGEHTDYNLGFVFPIALEMACYTVTASRQDNQLRIYSADFDAEFVISTEQLSHARPSGEWRDYVVGVAQGLVKAGVRIQGADLCISSDVPVGSGLSSSAALEISTAVALLGSQPMDGLDIALLGQRAESQFVGVPCGIMDQYASVFGREGAAIQIDCRSLEHEYIPLPGDARMIAVNSMVKHELGTSAYRDRVAECQAAVTAMQAIDKNIQSLRDASIDFFVNVQEQIAPVPRRRAHHVISENQRVLEFGKAAREHDLEEMGKLFVASHRSMQYDYEISCEEIDFLVDTAIGFPGVYGARMTGGGFGGCTVNLIAPDAVESFREHLTAAYQKKFAKTPVFYDCKPAAGAGRMQVS